MDGITAAELLKSLASDHPPLVVDVRKEAAFRASDRIIRGALRRDPLLVAEWGGSLPRDVEVVVYCVHGHEVSQGVAKALGARFLEGGIEGWTGETSRKAQETR